MTTVTSHAEAYLLMTYDADDGSGDTERVWNSRDGAVPPVITLRDGRTATRKRPELDRRPPTGWTPPAGMRVFTTLTPGRARALAEHTFDSWKTDPRYTSHPFLADPGTAITRLASDALTLGVPDLIDPGGCWHLTYRTWHDGITSRPHTAILDGPWCAATRTDPATLTRPEQAAWALAATLGTGADLASVRWVPHLPHPEAP